MNLYHLTLKKPTAINHATTFPGSKTNEVVISRGKYLELWSLEDIHGTQKFSNSISTEVFGLVRSIAAFRVTNQGAAKDYLVVGSDSGRLVILEVDHVKKQFIKIHQETFGKTGCRRIVPGQYVAVDPKGRAIMIGAIEKQKFVYVLNRDQSNRLTISSPLEAHSSNTILYSMIAVDNGFENPTFACLEVDYNEGPQKAVAIYELDLGLNNVIKKSSKEVSDTAHSLIPVLGGDRGPSGVLVCSENCITHISLSGKEVSVPIPRRYRKDGDYSRGNMITCHTMIEKKAKFFFFLQTEEGDILYLELLYKGKTVEGMIIHYMDSCHVAVGMCTLSATGHIFLASEFGNHQLYHIRSLDKFGKEIGTTLIGKLTVPLYQARQPVNLNLKEELDSISPVIDFKAVDLLNQGIPQLYTLCGRANRSSLRILKHGLPVYETAVNNFKVNPLRVWSVKKSEKEPFDNYVVVSFTNHTIVLGIGDNIEQVDDAGFLASVPTLCVSLFKNSLLQIHPNAIRQIFPDKKVQEWESKRHIKCCAVNDTQVVIANNGGEVSYFEANPKGILVNIQSQEMNQEVACLALGTVPSGSLRSKLMAIGFYDKTVRILSCDPNETLSVLARIAMSAEPESIQIVDMGTDQDPQLFLFVGLSNGVLMRYSMDAITGEVSDPRPRVLGSKPVKLIVTRSHGQKSVLALSNRSWLCYNHQNKFTMTPLSYDPLTFASSFNSKPLPEGFVAIAGSQLKFASIEKYGENFNQQVIPLKYTPRKFVIQEKLQKMFILESDHNAYSLEEMKKLEEDSMDLEDGKIDEFIKYQPNSGTWASYIHVLETKGFKTEQMLPMEKGEVAFSLAWCTLGTEEFLCVGTGSDVKLYPRSNSGGFLNLYRMVNGQLELVHKTEVEDIPTAMIPFQKKLAVGIGKILRVYDFGKKKLLRKSENKNFPNLITTLTAEGQRLYVGDVMESFHFVKYKPEDASLSIFADNTTPRWTTCSGLVDYHTVAGGDKFGNIFISRLPNEVNDSLEEDPNSNRWMWDRGVLGGAPQKAKEIVSFHVGEVVTSLQKVNFVPGSSGVLMYMTIMGSIGCLVPFSLKEDVEFFSLLEMHMRQEGSSLVGRDHLSFVSYYYPVKGVIDGDLLEMYEKMPLERQKGIAEELDKTPNEIKKKLQELRNLSGY